MGNAFGGLMAGLFVALCVYSSHYHPAPRRAREVFIWRDSKSATIASIFNLKPEDLDTATDIFGN